MPPDRQQRPDRSPSAAADEGHDSTPIVDDATSSGPTWYLDARPLSACHEHADEYAIDCPTCGAEALAWRSRPAVRGSGYACVCGARGALWGLL